MGLIFCKIHGFCINRHKDIFREKKKKLLIDNERKLLQLLKLF